MNTKIHHEGDKVWLEGIEGWSASEKASSVHAAFEAIMKALDEDISYDYLVGISSLAFRMQIGGLCPSSPHPACGYNCVERALQVLPWKLKGYGIEQNKIENPMEIYEIIVQSIDKGIPVITGEEDDGIIIGYQKENKGFICLHPWHHNGKKPFVVSSLAEICWGIGIITERKTETIDHRILAIDSLKQSVKMAKKKKVKNYHVGFKAWEQYIKSLKKLNENRHTINDDDILGNAWIYECLVQYRNVAANYLILIEDQFDETVKNHLRNASVLYRQISQDILNYDKGLKEITGDYNSLKKSVIWTKEMYHDQIKRLENALPLEIQAINEIERALSSI